MATTCASSGEDSEAAFVIYREGVALRLQWLCVPPIVAQHFQRPPALRLCCVSPQLLMLLTADQCLYTGRLNESRNLLQLNLQRTAVLDVDYCQLTRLLFIVTAAGEVLMQHLEVATQLGGADAWRTLSFDPLELAEEGVRVQRVCCSAEAVLFVTRQGELYVMGTCGDIFAAEAQPKQMRLFEEGCDVLDLAAGDDFFVALLQNAYDECGDPLELEKRKAHSRAGSGTALRQYTAPELDPSLEDSAMERKQELNSNSSVRSFSSKSSNRSHSEQDFEANLQLLLRHGYALLNTQVQTFGATNNGLLGTGDHIRRASVNHIQRLQAVGVRSIAAGREHSVARTLDSRIFHWGLNKRQQLSGRSDVTDLSAPTELKLDSVDLDAQQRTILAACCGDFHTVLLNARNELHGQATTPVSSAPLHAAQDFLALSMRDVGWKTSSLLLVADAYTLHNRRQFQRDYHTCLSSLQADLQLMLRHRHAVQMLQLFQQKNPAAGAAKQLQPICVAFLRMLCLLAALVRSMERFYRGECDSPAELVFVKQHRECIQLFEEYTRSYCDLYSVDGYAELGSACPFPAPFHALLPLVQCLEQLTRTRPEFRGHLDAWQECSRQHRIDLELAESTLEFWQRHERNAKVRQFRSQHRRVILNSAAVPVKLAGNTLTAISGPQFILFSDCLCQVGGQLLTYPLATVWLKNGSGGSGGSSSDTSFRIVTPERSFTLIARSADDKKLWYNQLEMAILKALGRPADETLSSARTTAYVFSRGHTKFPNVHAYGRWRGGVLHGSTYLEYPDGRYYFGEMRSGEIEGYGKMVTPGIGMYEGTFRAGKFHGHGTYEMKDEVYEGNFRDGLFHGHGLMRSNNYTYVGEYQANARSGYGVLDDTISGDKYMGMFADNRRTGAGTCITMNGDYFEGIFVNDELAGTGIAVFENDFYYEGELTMHGPIGKGTYYMPSGVVDPEDSSIGDEDASGGIRQLSGNVLSGQLAGSWNDVRVITGTVSVNRQFSKYPKSIGELVVDNNRKWRSLFENFEEQLVVLGTASTDVAKGNTSPPTLMNSATKHVWSRIAVFMTTQREREKKLLEQQDSANQPQQQSRAQHSYFARNISLGYAGCFDKASLTSANSLLASSTTAKSSILDLSGSGSGGGSGLPEQRRAHSQETLYDTDMNEFDFASAACTLSQYQSEESSFGSLLNAHLSSWANDSTASIRSSFDSVLNLSESYNNNSFCSQNGLEFVPSFGISTLSETDVGAVREYLVQAFKDRHHPLCLLNQRIANCFYISYGCWKVKPTPILAKQAMREWESISKRVYRFVRKMFPALPDDYCVLEETREVVSHINLLYPIVLSEGIYSTLFVLYANKYSRKDEMYRQNLLCAEKLEDAELADLLGLDGTLAPIVGTALFADAIQSLKQLQEKYSPKAMLTVIERCMQQITDAHKMLQVANAAVLAAEGIIPLTLFLVLRAAVPHLGAELALLDDLTGGANFQFEMSGIAGYCYITLKAAYEHITAKPLPIRK